MKKVKVSDSDNHAPVKIDKDMIKSLEVLLGKLNKEQPFITNKAKSKNLFYNLFFKRDVFDDVHEEMKRIMGDELNDVYEGFRTNYSLFDKNIAAYTCRYFIGPSHELKSEHLKDILSLKGLLDLDVNGLNDSGIILEINIVDDVGSENVKQMLLQADKGNKPVEEAVVLDDLSDVKPFTPIIKKVLSRFRREFSVNNLTLVNDIANDYVFGDIPLLKGKIILNCPITFTNIKNLCSNKNMYRFSLCWRNGLGVELSYIARSEFFD